MKYVWASDCDEFSGNTLELNGDGQIQIYPNPTFDILNVKMPMNMSGDYDYKIVNLEGKIISEGKINTNQSTIDVKEFATGKYILTIQNSERIITGHFILRN